MLRNIPKGMKFDEEKFSAMFSWIGSLIQSWIVKTYADVIFCLSEKFSEKTLIELIDWVNITYIGIKKFFEENQIPIAESPKEEVEKMRRTPATKKRITARENLLIEKLNLKTNLPKIKNRQH